MLDSPNSLTADRMNPEVRNPFLPGKHAYRKDIDGLRAIAVILVVGYHALPNLLPGGFVGVDIFFVISGYLITDIVSREILAGDFSLRGFYGKRIRRIFPALLLIIFSTLAVGWYVFPVKEFQSLGINIAGSAAFIENLVLLREGGYFDVAAIKKPLLHIWSLGIEEQYYILWPLILMAGHRLKLNAISLVCALAATSFLVCIGYMKGNPDYGFYLPTSRAWELLVGSGLSIVAPVLGRKRPLEDWAARFERILRIVVYAPGARAERLVLKNLLATIAIATVGFVSVKFNSKLPYPGYYAAAPVVAAVLLIIASDSWPNRIFLTSRPMVFIGVISYPLYLWHYPVISYGHLLKPRGVPPLAMAAFVLGSVALAWLTYRFVERPVRFGRARPHSALPLLAMMGIACAIGVFIFRGDGLPDRMPKSLRQFMLTGDETSAYWRRGRCLLLPDQGPDAFGPECAGNGRRPIFFLWGDSYAAAQYPGFLHFGEQAGFDVAEFTSSACPPALGFVHPERPFCTPINDFVVKRIQELRPDVVILHSTWSYNPAALETGLRATLKELRAIPIKKVILLGPVPQWSGDGLSANVIFYYYENGLSLIPAKTTYRLANLDADERMRKMAESLGVEYLSPWKVLCDGEGCLARVGPNGENLTAFDSGHMTVAGSTYLVGKLLPDLMRGVK